MHRTRRTPGGFTIIELLIVLAIVGVLTAVGSTLLPRQGMAVGEAQRILAAAITFTRFEAIKRNEELTVSFEPGSRVVRVEQASGGASIREYSLNPQDDAVVIKSANPNGAMTFNSRGVATVPVARTIEIGLTGRTDHDRTLLASGQGNVSEVQ